MRAGIVVLGFAVSLLSLAALADLALAAKVEAKPEKPAVRMVWVDVQGAAGAIRPVVFMETRDLLRGAGTDVHWETSDGSGRLAHPSEFQVIVMKAAIAPLSRGVMGAAQARSQSRTVWVFLAGVRSALGLRSPGRDLMTASEMLPLGRAVARVILHEIVHATDPRRPHALEGLMARCLGRETLLAPKLLLDGDLREVFRIASSEPGPPPEDPRMMASSNPGGTAPEVLEEMITD